MMVGSYLETRIIKGVGLDLELAGNVATSNIVNRYF